jgi:hypothetical protein
MLMDIHTSRETYCPNENGMDSSIVFRKKLRLNGGINIGEFF